MTVSFDSARARRERVTASRAKRVVIAKGNAVVPAGERKPVKVKLTSAGRRMVKGRKRLSARMKIATLAPNGKRVVRTRSVTLKR